MRALKPFGCVVLLAVTECKPDEGQEKAGPIQTGAPEEPLCPNPSIVLDPPNGDVAQAGLGSPCRNSNPCQTGMVCCKNTDQQSVCDDIDECDAGTGTACCSQICINTIGSFTCDCEPEYVLAADGYTCLDAVECDDTTCSGQGQCIEKFGGGTQCECDAGWTGDDCSQNIDDCTPNPCDNGGTCTDQVYAFSCACTHPWMGTTCGTGKVKAVFEKEKDSEKLGTSDQDVMDFGSASCSGEGTCLEVVDGGLQCVCNAGYTGTTDCTDIDECTEGTLVCGSNANCVNTPGGAECACDPGGIDAPQSCPDLVSYANAWVQSSITSYLVARSLGSLAGLTIFFYFKSNGNNDYITQFLFTIESPGFADELRFGWDDRSKLKIFGNPDANSVLTGAANAAAVFDVAHRHCFVWSQGNYIKWFYDISTPGVLEKAADEGDDGSASIKRNNGILIPLQEQNANNGGGLDPEQQVTGLISDIQVWDRALSDDEVEALDCEDEGNLLSTEDFEVVGIDRFMATEEFFCSA